MKLLVIGGGQFFGAALVDAAIAAGHDVTAVQRGETSRPAPAGLELLKGDRATDLPALLGERSFDAVVDTCGYMPQVVRTSCELLQDRTGRYVFVSSVSAYAPITEGEFIEDLSPMDETAPDTDVFEPVHYGGHKVQCERVVSAAFADRAVLLRPGLIVGPLDHTDRFAYWPRRFSQPGPVLMPHGPDFSFQVIDARDQAEFVLRIIGDGRSGAVNSIGHRQTFADLVAACAPETEVVYADDAWLLERGVMPWSQLPLWLPPESSLLGSETRAREWGLTPRPLSQTCADTLAWDVARGLPTMSNTLAAEREMELLAELRA